MGLRYLFLDRSRGLEKRADPSRRATSSMCVVASFFLVLGLGPTRTDNVFNRASESVISFTESVSASLIVLRSTRC